MLEVNHQKRKPKNNNNINVFGCRPPTFRWDRKKWRGPEGEKAMHRCGLIADGTYGH